MTDKLPTLGLGLRNRLEELLADLTFDGLTRLIPKKSTGSDCDLELQTMDGTPATLKKAYLPILATAIQEEVPDHRNNEWEERLKERMRKYVTGMKCIGTLKYANAISITETGLSEYVDTIKFILTFYQIE